MTAFLGVLVLSCIGDVAPGLQAVYCRAVYAWAPYQAEVRKVKWCEPDECSGMGGGVFHYDSRVISIDPNWPFTGDGLLLTVEHEYGHALGLQHRWGNSIMKPGWDPPFAAGPTEEDFSELSRMYDVGALHPLLHSPCHEESIGPASGPAGRGFASLQQPMDRIHFRNGQAPTQVAIISSSAWRMERSRFVGRTAYST